MKKFFGFIVFLFLVLPVNAVTLSGGVVYTVESARKEAFANVEYTIDKSIIDDNLVDPNFRENKRAIKRKITMLPDRYITYFSDGSYGIVYKTKLYYEFSYTIDGKLDGIGKRTSLDCPLKIYKYNTNNELIEIRLQINLNESYVFQPNGQLFAHWINGKCYDLKGNLQNQRY